MGAQLSLLAVFAHPDDESFGVGGTLAKYAAEGVDVSLVVATSGEAGEIADTSLAYPSDLGQLRRQELQCAADTLGVKQLRLLGYADGQLAQANPTEVERKLVAIIRELRPQVVITFDPAGTYGHPDHIAIHRCTLTAWQVAGDPDQHVEQIRSWPAYAPPKLYFRATPAHVFRLLADRFSAIRSGLGLEQIDVSAIVTPDELVTTVIDVSSVADVKRRAIECHRSQLAGGRLGDTWPAELRNELLSREYFSLFGKRLQPGEPLETDLFSGLR